MVLLEMAFWKKLCEPYMTYTWFVMIFLVVVGKLTLSNIEMIPGKRTELLGTAYWWNV